MEPSRVDPIRKTLGGDAIRNNPRDNLVTMIAVVSGEEAFTDQNGNGTWDPGEPFVDLTEPFVDADDDGTWDPNDERFLDTNGNGTWDGKNGKWDARTQIWVQERLLWTGAPALEDLTGPGASAGAAPTIALQCPAGTPIGGYCNGAGPPVTASLFLADPWLNAIARNAAADACTVSPHDPFNVPSKSVLWADSGVRSTYPPGDWMTLKVSDARDPLLPPLQQVPKHQPVAFQWDVRCSFTSSAIDGRVVQVTLPVVGTTE